MGSGLQQKRVQAGWDFEHPNSGKSDARPAPAYGRSYDRSEWPVPLPRVRSASRNLRHPERRMLREGRGTDQKGSLYRVSCKNGSGSWLLVISSAGKRTIAAEVVCGEPS
ncbi:hypothetical protein GFGA_1d0502 [Gluconobacter frateurii NBRC 103465]|nr:hypothetical protein GFGA_1d0502 [Gluconobacter frateurii NBRC 103465]